MGTALNTDTIVNFDASVLEGGDLTAEAVRRVEERLSSPSLSGPLAVGACVDRARLLGYYNRHARLGDAPRERYSQQVLWFFEHLPHMRSGFLYLDPDRDRPEIVQAKALWRVHLSRSPEDIDLLDCAASFLQDIDPRASERLWLKAKSLAPGLDHWPHQLGRLYSVRSKAGPLATRRKWAKKALASLEEAFRLAKEPGTRFSVLVPMAYAALNAGELKKAKRYSRQALRLSPEFKTNWSYGSILNQAHSILGRVALKAGHIRVAKKELLESANTPGSPELNYYGPSFELVTDLARRGEWDAVAQYLKSIKRFWNKAVLEKWAGDIAARRVPNFEERSWIRG